MAINRSFSNTFGNLGAPKAQDDRPKAEYWMNIGYMVEVEVDGETEQRFVSLPTGIPLDTMEKLPTRSSNVTFAQFQSSRNDLLDQVLDAAKQLEPGEDRIIGEVGGLQIQIRRVNAEQPTVKPEQNMFARKLSLVGA